MPKVGRSTVLQAVLEAVLQAGEGGRGGVLTPAVNDLTSGDPAVSAVVNPAVQGGSGGARRRRPAREPRHRPHQTQRIWFWRDLFRHINASYFQANAALYPWQNSDRKILANAARKYSTPWIMAMWDVYFKAPELWHPKTGGTIFGMVRDSARLLDHPDFKKLAQKHEARLAEIHGLFSAGDVLKAVGVLNA